LVGPKQILAGSPTRYGHWVAVQSEDTLRNLNKETAYVFNDKIVLEKTLKNRYKNNSLAVCNSGGIID